jgi:hypothetical protein
MVRSYFRIHVLWGCQLRDVLYLAVVEGEEDSVGDVHRVAGVAVFRHKGVHGSRTGWLPAAITTCQEILSKMILFYHIALLIIIKTNKKSEIFK